MNSRQRNLVTGVVVIVALATLTMMVLLFSGRAMGLIRSRGTPVAFISDRADGLSDGSPVFFAGVEVGKITEVKRLDDNLHVKIEGELDNTPPLPANLVGEIKSQSSLGTSSMVSLRLNGPPTGVLQTGQEITIHFSGGLIPPEITDFVDTVNRQKLVEHVDATVVSLRAQIEKVGSVMQSVQGMVGDPKVQEDLRQTLLNVRSVTDRAKTIGAKLETLTDNANSTLGEVRTTVVDAHKMIGKTDQDVDRLARQISDDLDKLGGAFAQFQQVAEKVNKGPGTAGLLVNDPKLYDEMATTAKELNVAAASLERLVDQWEHEGITLGLKK